MLVGWVNPHKEQHTIPQGQTSSPPKSFSNLYLYLYFTLLPAQVRNAASVCVSPDSPPLSWATNWFSCLHYLRKQDITHLFAPPSLFHFKCRAD